MNNEWKNLVNVSVWVSPFDVFKPVFVEEYSHSYFIVRIFNRTPIAEKKFTSRQDAENYASRNGKVLVVEDMDPLAENGDSFIPTGQTFEYWYKTDAAQPYYVIVNMTPGEKVCVKSLMGDSKPMYLFDSYEIARISLLQDIFKRVDQLDPD